jgi:hypothetical protein
MFEEKAHNLFPGQDALADYEECQTQKKKYIHQLPVDAQYEGAHLFVPGETGALQDPNGSPNQHGSPEQWVEKFPECALFPHLIHTDTFFKCPDYQFKDVLMILVGLEIEIIGDDVVLLFAELSLPFAREI